jgi:hypothetical protein
MTVGAKPCFVRSLRISFRAECFVASAPHDDIEDLTFVIGRAPEVHRLAGDPCHHLIEMPAPAGSWPTTPQALRDGRPELQHPSPHRLVRDTETALRRRILYAATALDRHSP